MKAFYAITAGVMLALAATPFALLKAEDHAYLAGKTVSYGAYGAKIKSVDPATCGDTTSSSVIQGHVYEGLYGYHYLKRPVELVAVLADGMPDVSDDLRTYTIRLKSGIEYAPNKCFGTGPDGPKTRAVRAEDFVLAFKRIADYHVGAELAWPLIKGKIVGLEDYRRKTAAYKEGDFSRYDTLAFEGVEAVDAHTLRLRLTRPFPQLVHVLAMHNYAPIPREVVATYLRPSGKTEIRTPEAVVGTGAYVLREWIRAGKVVLERNPAFRRETYPAEGAPGDRAAGLLDDAGKRVPFIDVLHRTYVEESNPAWMLFLTKQHDVAGIPREAFDTVIGPAKKLTDAWRRKGIRLIKGRSPAVYWLVFNMEDPVVGKSRALRQALQLAYDVETHIDVLYNGRGLRATNVVPSTFAGHDAVEIDGKPVGGPSPYCRFDRDAAKRKLAEARDELAAADALNEDGQIPTLTLDLPGRGARTRRMGQFVQQQFRKLGIKVELVLNDWPTLQRKVRRKRCQIYTMGWHADYPDAQNFFQLFYSENIDAGTNNANFSDEQFDALYEQASKMMPSPQRAELYAQMVEILNEKCPVLLLSEPISFLLVRDWVSNVKPHPIGYGFAKYRRIDVPARRKAGGR
ncbi:MAG: hypothetical protein KGY99_02455 [Phycisphaerae bacterium]|nr:hypothetical protein [Phycisphaerae bacterium]